MSIYLYGLLPTFQFKGKSFQSLNGIDKFHTTIEIVEEVTAIFCYVRDEEFTESVVKEKMDNPKWLHKQAMHHHDTIVNYSKAYLFLPSKFCTIYSNLEKLRKEILQKQSEIVTLFEQLKETEEWNLKMYYEKSRFLKYFEQHSEISQKMKEELKSLPPGMQYLLKKKQGQLLELEAQKELRVISQTLEELLLKTTNNNKTRENWSRNATGRKIDMFYNSTSLVSKENVKKFEELINEFIKVNEEKGIFVELSGPWPFYRFASLEDKVV